MNSDNWKIISKIFHFFQNETPFTISTSTSIGNEYLKY